MERQLKRAFKNRIPNKRNSSPVAVVRVRKYKKPNGIGVMIVPPKLGTKSLIERQMKKIRAEYTKQLGGQTLYNDHIKKVNEDFRAFMASKEVRI